jgi:hypothetical protein
MMKSTCASVWIGFLVCLACVPSVASGQRLHAIILNDTSPWAQWGEYQLKVVLDGAIMRSLVATNVPSRQLSSYPYDLSSDEAAVPGRILALVRSIHATPADAVLFYFSGHGGNDDRGQYLALAGGRLYRDQIRAAVDQTGCRLGVILTDCCNQRSDGRAFGVPMMEMEPPPQVTPLFRSLFFQPAGLVDINASSPGEAAFFYPLDAELDVPAGSIFTSQVEQFVYRYKNQPSTWEHFLRSVSLNVHLAFREHYPHGAVGAKGGTFQSDQNVYAFEFPGMPAREGTRSGMTIREYQHEGVMIIRVRPGYPAAQVYDLARRQYVSLQPGEMVIAANEQPIRTVPELVEAVRTSPQVLRLRVRSPQRGEHDVLMRLRY